MEGTAQGAQRAQRWERASMSQMVQVVSMEDVPRRLRSVSFQSKDVSGAQNSLFLFCARSTMHAHAVNDDRFRPLRCTACPSGS